MSVYTNVIFIATNYVEIWTPMVLWFLALMCSFFRNGSVGEEILAFSMYNPGHGTTLRSLAVFSSLAIAASYFVVNIRVY